jgi:hypothetical protein
LGRRLIAKLGQVCRENEKSYPIVIARLDRAIQYSRAPMMESKSCGVLDTPLEPVIGLAEGETRWRSMTAYGKVDVFRAKLTRRFQPLFGQ